MAALGRRGARRYCGRVNRWLVAVLVVLAVACGSGPQAQPAPSDSAAAKAASQALGFTAPLVGCGQLEGGDLAGRDVVLWFWAPW